MDRRQLLVTRTLMRSGRRLLAAWEELPDGKPVPKGASVMRDARGDWWVEVPDGNGMLAIVRATGRQLGQRSTHWIGFWEAT